MAHTVFISYTASDNRAAHEICRELESTGVACWIAPRDVPPGEAYAATLYDALDRTRALVVVFSRHTNASPHVLREVTHAMDRKIPVFPVRIDKSLPKGPLGLLIGTLQWIERSDFRPNHLPHELALAVKGTEGAK